MNALSSTSDAEAELLLLLLLRATLRSLELRLGTRRRRARASQTDHILARVKPMATSALAENQQRTLSEILASTKKY